MLRLTVLPDKSFNGQLAAFQMCIVDISSSRQLIAFQIFIREKMEAVHRLTVLSDRPLSKQVLDHQKH